MMLWPLSFRHVSAAKGTRANIYDEEDIKRWMSEYSKINRTNWILRSNIESPRIVCRKVFICKETKVVKENKCSGNIDILIKLTTSHTMFNDKFVKEGLPAVIKVHSEHNHPIDKSNFVYDPPRMVHEFDSTHNGYILPKRFNHLCVDNYTLRANLECEQDIINWVKEFSGTNRINWIETEVFDFISSLCGKKYICEQRESSNCIASLTINIKLTTKWTVYSDEHIKNGLPTVITFGSDHNHTPSDNLPQSFVVTEYNGQLLPECFTHATIDNSIRCNVMDEDDMNKWMEEFSKMTKTNWMTKLSKTKDSVLCCKVFICKKSVALKVCTMKIDFSIKKNILCYKKYPCVVRIINEHNHPEESEIFPPDIKPIIEKTDHKGQLLPESFNHIRIAYSSYRINLQSYADIQTWREEYGKNTFTSWNVKKSLKKNSTHSHRKIFACHHSNVSKNLCTTRETNNTECKATFTILIQNETPTAKKSNKYVEDGYYAIVRINDDHNHPTDSVTSVSKIRRTLSMRKRFIKYFNEGLGLQDAMNLHKTHLELQYGIDSPKILNTLYNPKYRTIRAWHDCWRSTNFKEWSVDGIFMVLKEKQKFYEEKGCILQFQKDPFVIVIITPLMQWANQLPSARDVAFLDSASNSKAKSYSITRISTASNIGAMPLAILITQRRLQSDFKAAYSLLKKSYPIIFNERGHPETFITVYSRPEVFALNDVWPESKTLLCRFHVSETIWYWLSDKANNIMESHRKILYNNFNNILMAINVEQATAAYFIAIEPQNRMNGEEYEYQNWIVYLKSLWERRESWCLAFRDENIRIYQCGNWNEVTLRIYRDKMLSLNKLHNPMSLLDFICGEIEEFYVEKFKQFVLEPYIQPNVFIKSLLAKSSGISKDAIIQFNPKFYQIQCVNLYVIDLGTCSCDLGTIGRFCDHQAAVYYYYDESIPDAALLSIESLYRLGIVVFGDKAPDISSFMVQPINFDLDVMFDEIPSSSLDTIPITFSDNDDEIVKGIKESVIKSFTELVDSSDVSIEGLKIINDRMRMLKMDEEKSSFLSTDFFTLWAQYSHSNIWVQSNSHNDIMDIELDALQ